VALVLGGVQLLGSGSLAERIWAKPSASVLAIDATRVADASNTLAPVARAKVSVRLAPGDDAPRPGRRWRATCASTRRGGCT